MTPLSLLRFAFLAASPGAIPGQGSEPSLLQDTASAAVVATLSALHEEPAVRFDEPGDGALWARGKTYKAQFTAEGITYVPFLGSDAPRSFPISFALAAARIGGAALDWRERAAPARAGNRVIYDRGSLLEIYDLEAESVEQIFVVRDRLGAGDLVVTLDVATDLGLAEGPEGLEFAAPVLGAVRYGRAVAFGADGAAQPASTSLGPGGIELRVPAPVVAGAAFPLTIDPVISTVFIETSTSTNAYDPDVSYDATSDRFLVAYNVPFSATDWDVWAVEVTGGGTLVAGTGAWIDSTSANWFGPRVAANDISNQHLVVAAVGAIPAVGQLGSRQVRGRTRQAGSTTMGSQFTISTGFASHLNDHHNPDVGGNPHFLPPTSYCVAWEGYDTNVGNGDIWARLVTTGSGLLGAAAIEISHSVNDDGNPSISKSCGTAPTATQSWTVVWERQWAAFDNDIYARRISTGGAAIGNTLFVDASSAFKESPTVTSITNDASGARKYLVVYRRGGASHGPYGKLFSILGSAPLAEGLLFAEPPFGVADEIDADTDGTRFVVGFRVYDTTTDAKNYVGTFHEAGGSLFASEPPFVVDSHLPGGGWGVAVTSKRSGGGTGARYFVAWDRWTGGTPITTDIRGIVYAGTIPVAGSGSVPTGCGGVTLSTTGDPAIGQTLSYTLHTPGGGTPFVMVSVEAAPIPLCPAGCALGIVFPPILMVPGLDFSAAVPPDPILFGVELAVQGLVLGTPGACPGPPAHAVTQTIVTTIG